jgi:hypothetical protein
VLRIDTQLRQCPAAQRGRRIEQHHAAAERLGGVSRARDARQRRHQQAQLAQAWVRQQQFGEHAVWPAAAG